MRTRLFAAMFGVAIAASGAIGASAQSVVSLSGTYRCVQGCVAGYANRPAFITQNGGAINLVTEAGVSAQAWADWFSLTSRIWIETLPQGAIYSPDGTIIQFDHGAVWRRVVEPTPEMVTYCARRYRSYEPGQPDLSRIRRHPASLSGRLNGD